MKLTHGNNKKIASTQRTEAKKKHPNRENGKQIKMSLIPAFSEMPFVYTFGINIAIFADMNESHNR